jgi:hypothetical protein
LRLRVAGADRDRSDDGGDCPGCVPLVRALHGELPIELSTRGARYAETSEVVIEELKVRLTEVEDHLDEMAEIVDVLGEPITG